MTVVAVVVAVLEVTMKMLMMVRTKSYILYHDLVTVRPPPKQ